MAEPQAAAPTQQELAHEAALFAERRPVPELPRTDTFPQNEGGAPDTNADLREAIRQDQLILEQQQARVQAEEGGGSREKGKEIGIGNVAAAVASKGGIDPKRQIGIGMIRACWSALWLSGGHTAYFLFILFFAGWASKYVRQYIPEVGMEWIPQPIARKTPKFAFLPLKLGEIVAISFALIWVFMYDLIILAIAALLLSFFMTIKS